MKFVTTGQDRTGMKKLRISHDNDALQLKIYFETFD